MEEEQAILVEESGPVRILTLNRPRILNSLNLPMVSGLLGRRSREERLFGQISRMADLFEQWEKDEAVSAILIKGAGRAFSAGGDLRMFTMKDESWKEVVYKKYWLDFHLHSYTKPRVVIWHGLVMGGGAGFTLPSTYRIVTEGAVFCMPEVAIGFHTDCGGSYFLSRLPGRLGEYLALTGARLNHAEMLACGLATHYVPAQNILALELELGSGKTDSIRSTIEKFHATAEIPEDSVFNRMGTIDECFSKDRVEDIIQALAGENYKSRDVWLEKTIQILKRSSPTGLKQTLASIRRGRSKNVRECLEQEYRLTLHCLRGTVSGDLYEGIRAVVIDKDNKPKWNPGSLDEVTDEMIKLNFGPVLEGEELQLPVEGSMTRWQGKWGSRSTVTVC